MEKLTRFERTRVISARALQLALGAPALIKADKDSITPYDLAKKEFEAAVLPFVVIRRYPSGGEKRIELS